MEDNELRLRDALYELQSGHERCGAELEPAVFAGEDDIIPQCSVFKDNRTGDRIVLTKLPLDEADFEGAAIWISNPRGISIVPNDYFESLNDDFEQIKTRKDVIFYIGRGATSVCYDIDEHETLMIDNNMLAEIIEVPKILPIPQSETDPRDLPNDLEFLHTPTTDTYTLATRIFDTELEYNHSLLGNRSGIVKDDNLSIQTTYDLQVTENIPDGLNTRISEFDREMLISIMLGDPIKLSIKMLGSEETKYLNSNQFRIRVFREGIIIDAKNSEGRKILCVPTPDTKQFIDQVLQNAEDLTV